MLQRVQFVTAIINEPELLILDGPFSGLDPVTVRLLKGLVADEQRRGATILFSPHMIAHAEELYDHVVMIVGVAAACATVWFAAKVFRIGLLMHGKPPDFRTLLCWGRAA